MEVRRVTFREQQFYAYQSFYFSDLVTHFINRVLNPVIWIKNRDDLSAFLDPSTLLPERSDFFPNKMTDNWYFSRMQKKTRIVGLFHDKREFADEFKSFK